MVFGTIVHKVAERARQAYNHFIFQGYLEELPRIVEEAEYSGSRKAISDRELAEMVQEMNDRARNSRLNSEEEERLFNFNRAFRDRSPTTR